LAPCLLKPKPGKYVLTIDYSHYAVHFSKVHYTTIGFVLSTKISEYPEILILAAKAAILFLATEIRKEERKIGSGEGMPSRHHIDN
jgi:hypothetical protein